MNRNFKQYIDQLNTALLLVARTGKEGSPRFVTMYRNVQQKLDSLQRQGLGMEYVMQCRMTLNGIYDRYANRFEGTGIRKYNMDNEPSQL